MSMYPHRSIPGGFVFALAFRSSSPAVRTSSSTYRMQVDHMAMDTSQGVSRDPP